MVFDSPEDYEAREQRRQLMEYQSRGPNANFVLDFARGFLDGFGGKPYSIIGAVIGGGGAYFLTPFLHAGTSPVALVLFGAFVGLFWKWVLALALFAGLLAGGYWVITQQKIASSHQSGSARSVFAAPVVHDRADDPAGLA